MLSAIRSGDLNAFAELYDVYERAVFAVALRAVGDRECAEEIVQDTFLKVWRNAARFDPAHGTPAAWIFTIAKRTAIDVTRKRRRQPVAPVAFEPPSVGDESDETWLAWEVNLALACLPAEQRTVIDMFVVAGYTHVEVAERLGIPLGTAKTRIYGGLKRLRESLQERGIHEVRP